jgi:cell division protein FtsI/penicillin-binding protein 2
MDPKTGAILAMTSKPDYNLNEFNKVAEAKNDYLFKNPAISGLYEPGSTFKSIVMAGAIDKGLVEPDTEEVFGKSIQVGSYEIGTAEDKAFGRETMTDVLVHSDNVGMVWVGNQMGNDVLYDTIKNFGFGEKTNIDLKGEESGVVRDKEKWRDINRATYTFGQGVSVTPLQLIAAYGALANGGKLMQPYIVKAVKNSEGNITETKPKEVRQVVSPETATKLSAMMVEVVNRGTGHHAKVDGYKIAGKTGTAQVPNPDGGYFPDDIKIGSLAGYAPAGDPKFVMLVKLDKPTKAEWGETSAGPMFGQMDKWLLNYLEVRPEALPTQ